MVMENTFGKEELRRAITSLVHSQKGFSVQLERKPKPAWLGRGVSAGNRSPVLQPITGNFSVRNSVMVRIVTFGV
jgi:hypothetical protein